jgi:hypothetical protein
LKALLIFISGIWALFDFKNLKVFKGGKSVPPRGKEDNIACLKSLALTKILVCIVKINPQPSLANEEDFLGAGNLSGHQPVSVRRYDMALRMLQVAELLTEVTRGEEGGSLLLKFFFDNQGKQTAFAGYFLKHYLSYFIACRGKRRL